MEPGQRIQQDRLPGTAWPYHSQEAALRQFEADVRQQHPALLRYRRQVRGRIGHIAGVDIFHQPVTASGVRSSDPTPSSPSATISCSCPVSCSTAARLIQRCHHVLASHGPKAERPRSGWRTLFLHVAPTTPGLPAVSADLASSHIEKTKGVAAMIAAGIGAVCFGLVVGWVTYRTLARRADGVSLSDIATVIGAVGGAAVVAIFSDKQLFGLYSIGLAVGFFGYLIAYVILNGRKQAGTIMGQGDTPIELNE